MPSFIKNKHKYIYLYLKLLKLIYNYLKHNLYPESMKQQLPLEL